MILDDSDLSPTQLLLLEVAIARYRLGEHIWTYERNPTSTKAAKELSKRGFLFLMGGITENTFRAGLSEEYRSQLKPYISPLEKRIRDSRTEPSPSGCDVVSLVQRLYDQLAQSMSVSRSDI